LRGAERGPGDNDPAADDEADAAADFVAFSASLEMSEDISRGVVRRKSWATSFFAREYLTGIGLRPKESSSSETADRQVLARR